MIYGLYSCRCCRTRRQVYKAYLHLIVSLTDKFVVGYHVFGFGVESTHSGPKQLPKAQNFAMPLFRSR